MEVWVHSPAQTPLHQSHFKIVPNQLVNMSPTAPPAATAMDTTPFAADGALSLPRNPSAVRNLAMMQEHLKTCLGCRHCTEPDPVQHPHAPFMKRAIELSRVAGERH